MKKLTLGIVLTILFLMIGNTTFSQSKLIIDPDTGDTLIVLTKEAYDNMYDLMQDYIECSDDRKLLELDIADYKSITEKNKEQLSYKDSIINLQEDFIKNLTAPTPFWEALWDGLYVGYRASTDFKMSGFEHSFNGQLRLKIGKFRISPGVGIDYRPNSDKDLDAKINLDLQYKLF